MNAKGEKAMNYIKMEEHQNKWWGGIIRNSQKYKESLQARMYKYKSTHFQNIIP